MSDPKNASSGSDAPPELESIVGRLRSLRKEGRRLKGAEKMEAVRLLRILREDDYSPKEISRLTYWPLTTVKLYTKGIRGKNRTSRQRAINTIRDMISAKITFRDIREYMETKSNLASQYQLTFKDIASHLQEMRQGSPQLSVGDIIRQHSQIKNSGLTISQLVEFLGYRAELEQQGFTIDLLRGLSRSSARYGGLAKAIEAINLYNNSAEIEQQIRIKEAQKGVVDTNLATLRHQVTELDGRRIDLEQGLATLEALERAGFDTYVLIILKELAERYDQNPQTFLEAVRQYGSLAEITSKLEEADAELKEIESRYSHRKAVLDICDKLFEFGFNIQAIEDLNRTAQRYGGQPAEVLKRTGMLGDLDAVERHVADLKVQETNLVEKVQELEAKIKTFKDSVTPFLDAINQGFTRASQNLGAVYRQQVAYVREAAETAAEAKALEKELGLARIINAAINNPQAIGRLPRDAVLVYAIALLNASYLMCVAKNIDTIFKARDVGITDPYNYLTNSDVRTLSLIQGAQRALEFTQSGTSATAAGGAAAVNKETSSPTKGVPPQEPIVMQKEREIPDAYNPEVTTQPRQQQTERSSSGAPTRLPYYILHEHSSQEGLGWIIRLEINKNAILNSWKLREKPPKQNKITAEQIEDITIDSLKSQSTVRTAGKFTELDSGTCSTVISEPNRIVVDIHGVELDGTYCLARIEPSSNRWEFYESSVLAEYRESS